MDFVPVRFKPDPEEVSNVKKPATKEADFDISKVDDVEVTEILAARTEEKTITSATAQDFSSRFLKTNVEKRPLGRMTSIDHVVETASSAKNHSETAPTVIKETKVTHTETVRTEETLTVADAIKMAEERERAEKAKHEDRGERVWEEELEEDETAEEESSERDEPEVEIEVEDEAKTSARLKEEALRRVEEEEKAKALAEAKRKSRFQRARFVNTEKIVQRPLSPVAQRSKPVVPTEEKPSAPVTIIEKPEKDSKVAVVIAIILTIILGAAAGTVAFLLLPK